MSYQPGTHLIATLFTEEIPLLNQYAAFQNVINQQIQQHGLNKLGEVYHNFTPSGFTGVVCLSESHISIHTWPEHGKINLDIYLSNYLRTNDETVIKIYSAVTTYFRAIVEAENHLTR